MKFVLNILNKAAFNTFFNKIKEKKLHRLGEIITYYIPSAKFFIGIFFFNERKHP
jgi:hypothetical protein